MIVAPFDSPQPFDTGMLKVSDLHSIYYEQFGNPDGIPILALHGGPGGGISRNQLRTIDPAVFRGITFDQRACGESEPFGETRENTTWDLVADIETVRQYLGIERWAVTGRSWGSTLALAYSITHREFVTALVPVAVFLGRKRDIAWMYQDGAGLTNSVEWREYRDFIPEGERDDLLSAYSKRIRTGSVEERETAARRLALWELSLLWTINGPSYQAAIGDSVSTLSLGVLETHYLNNGCFFEADNWIIENADLLRQMPGIIVHGELDRDCPVEQARELSSSWTTAELVVVPESGHAQDDGGNFEACIKAISQIPELIEGD